MTKTVLITDNTVSTQFIDTDLVANEKVEATQVSWLSIISWHHIKTLFRVIAKIMMMPFKDNIVVIKLTGNEKYSSDVITVTYIGDGSSYDHVIANLFCNTPKILSEQPVSCWNVNSKIKSAQKSDDMLIGDFDFPLSHLVNTEGSMVTPRWLKQKVTIADTWQEVLTGMRRKTRREAQRSIRKNNLIAQVIRDPEIDRYFYHRLYIPYINKRFTNQASLVEEKRFLKECADGQLIVVKQDDHILASVLVHLSGKQMTMAWTGIDKTHIKGNHSGIADALDYFSLLYAYKQGCDEMDMGTSRALINDGALQYKKKWGARISTGKIPKGIIFYKASRFSSSILSFLVNTPMIVRNDTGLCAVIWSESVTSDIPERQMIDQIKTQLEKYYMPGIKALRCFQCVTSRKEKIVHDVIFGIPCEMIFIPANRLLAYLQHASSDAAYQ